MKWFEKHTTDRSDLDARQIRQSFGIEGYGIYEVLQQIVAENMEGTDVKEWGYVAKDWTMESLAKEVGVSDDKFRQFIAFCNERFIIEKRDGRMFLPKMLERMNEYAKRQYRKSAAKKATTPETPDKQVIPERTECTDTTDTPYIPETTECSDNTDKPASQHITSQHITSQHRVFNTGDAVRHQEFSESQLPRGQTQPTDSLQPLGSLMQSRLPVIDPPGRGITKPWQEKAFRYAEKLKITLTDEKSLKARWMKAFKQAHEGRNSANLERAYTYLVDHPANFTDEEKINFFFSIFEKGLKNQGRGMYA